MARFVTRVELHQANADDYSNLHRAMANEGFRRTITASDGTNYHLPTAEYYMENTTPRDQVLLAARRAASTTNKRYGVLVTEAQVCTWYGLPSA